jgi:hypothetical protein
MSPFTLPFHLPPVEAVVKRRMRGLYALSLVLLVLFVLMIPGPAAAQQPAKPAASASDAVEPLPRWDTTGFIAWRGTRVVETDPSRRRWDARLVYGGTAGYYWTTNLKLEVEVSGTAPSDYYTFEPHLIDGVGYPLYIRSDHSTVTGSFGGRVIYQFFENVSFHPFVGAGAGWITARDRITTPRQSQPVRRTPDGPIEVVVISELQTRHRSESDAFGQMIAGFKTYPGERWFLRSDVQWSVGASRFHEITWHLGVGVDF